MNGIKNYLVQHGEHMLNDLIERERSKVRELRKNPSIYLHFVEYLKKVFT